MATEVKRVHKRVHTIDQLTYCTLCNRKTSRKHFRWTAVVQESLSYCHFRKFLRWEMPDSPNSGSINMYCPELDKSVTMKGYCFLGSMHTTCFWEATLLEQQIEMHLFLPTNRSLQVFQL